MPSVILALHVIIVHSDGPRRVKAYDGMKLLDSRDTFVRERDPERAFSGLPMLNILTRTLLKVTVHVLI